MRRLAILWSFLACLAPASSALAYPEYLDGLPDNRDDLSCATCHVTSGGGGACDRGGRCLNPFGAAFRAGGYDYDAVNDADDDADGDGQSNDYELTPTATLPGFPNAPDSAGCDMEACANATTYDGCGGSPLRCTPVVDGANQYTWSFSCDSGYSFSAPWTCTDIDECASNPCNTQGGGSGGSDGQGCTQTSPPGYSCSCRAGYGPSNGTCELQNECNLSPSPCVSNVVACSDPTSAVGDYVCTCPAGYEGNGRTSGSGCTEIDECARGLDDCTDPPAGICTNTDGSFACSCNVPGFTGATGRDCVDVDECSMPEFSNLCSTAATCVNSFGSWDCVCNAGFEGDGFTCVDVDECARDLDECHADATCTNSIGAYSCACNTGYEGSGVFCTDVNECMDGTDGCRIGEVCVNQLGIPNLCECEAGRTRAAPGEPCEVRCGDATRGQGEECDDGDADAGDGCSDVCEIEEGWACREPSRTGQSVCMETCGDGLIDVVEECDDGPANSDTVVDACRTTCVDAYCADGVVDTGEECDDGGANDDAAPDACRTTCHRPYCGDGVIDSGELCDLGGGVPGASIAGACTTLCAPDAGIDANDPPRLTGGAGCSVSGPRSAGGWLAGLVLALAALRRHRSRR